MASIEIIKGEKIDTTKYDKTFLGDVFMIHVNITDIDEKAKKMIIDISDKSWINKLDIITKSAFLERMNPTIDKLVNNIFNKIDGEATENFGEYLVSHTAGEVLSEVYSHKIIPLAELWKEQITGNPGFDFHTETLTNLIAFGEAKYRSTGNSYTSALNQIESFINDKKDIKELSDLKNLVNNESSENAINNKKAYVAAFSINGIQYDTIFDNILKSNHINPLLIYPEIYLIGVEISK